MRPETLLAKFSLKGLNYEQMQNGGGKGLFSLEEQLAMVGIAWKESPVGFLLLFVECLGDKHAHKMLSKAVMLKAIELTQEWKGQKSEVALAALVEAAIMESTNPLGQVCSCCNGTGRYLSECRHQRVCKHCKDGRVDWNTEIRFAAMCSGGFACRYTTFKRQYLEVLERLCSWLAAKRNAAMLSLMKRIEAEEAAA